ncbi:MAG: S8 family serine peptidase, partial [Phycisphaerales bacterium]|nr:S8 family serine peptidase [Phycisphaerales bacterium]
MRLEMHALTLFSLAGLVLGTAPIAAQAAEPIVPVVKQSDASKVSTQQSGVETISGKTLKVKMSTKNAVEYTVENPSWRESKAVRVVDANRPELTMTKTLFARVSVGVENEAALKNAVAAAGAALRSDRPGSHAFEKFNGLDTVFILEANSVEDAINMANTLEGMPGILWTEIEHRNPVKSHAITSDPSAGDQWHIDNPLGNDANIAAVYDRGITGDGVVVGILEADPNSFYHVDNLGIENIHPDLVNQLNRDLSIPTDPFNVSYSHGVSVAGLAGGEGNNGLAGSGVAYGAQLASLKNGSNINSGQSFSHELNDIDIVNSSWGPMNESTPNSNTGKVLVTLPNDFEIRIPQVTHSGLSRIDLIGLDQGLRLGREGKGRLFVFSAGNGNHFQGFDRFLTGNAISLPGLFGGLDYGYLDISGVDPTRNDGDGDGVP